MYLAFFTSLQNDMLVEYQILKLLLHKKCFYLPWLALRYNNKVIYWLKECVYVYERVLAIMKHWCIQLPIRKLKL